ncbi:nebulin-like isoform X2 [Lethenteron reissneri]|nr:nebulin-like isoform X2 [Lethenteron reissneri]XP_061410760.1 nebulin-like isoform X2 [Lethenteron reissneri]
MSRRVGEYAVTEVHKEEYDIDSPEWTTVGKSKSYEEFEEEVGGYTKITTVTETKLTKQLPGTVTERTIITEIPYDEGGEEEEEEEVEEIVTKKFGASDGPRSTQQSRPERKAARDVSAAPSEHLTVDLLHSKKAQDLYSTLKYKKDYEENKAIGFSIVTDTPERKRTKRAQDQISEVKYHKEWEKMKNVCHLDNTSRDVEHAAKVSKMVSKILYKEKYEDMKEHFQLPPDAPEFVHALKNSALYSKNAYKAEYEDEKATFFPYADSPELRRVASAQKIFSDIQYKQKGDAPYTSVADPPDVRQAKKNFLQGSDLKYREAYNKDVKGKWAETPYVDMANAKINAHNLSQIQYKADWEHMKDKQCGLQKDALPLKVAKAQCKIASNVEYKRAFEQARGQAACMQSVDDDPKIRHSMNVSKNRSENLYKKEYEKNKTKFHMPADSVHVVQAKNAQEMASNLDYKTSQHGYVLPPDCVTSQQARKSYDLQSDNLYKSDMDWMRGVGWVTSGSVDVEKVKRAGSILSERKYRQPAQQQPFTQVEDTPELVKAKSNKQLCSKLVYKADSEKRLHQYTMDADEPQLLQAKVNSINLSNKCYQFDYEENKATGYDLKADAIPFRAARASSNIVSDRKYKKEYEADKGKHIGARSLQDDPKMVHSMRVAKMQSQREYKKGYEKGKTSYHTPMDMLQVVEAKKAQAMASNVDYKTRLHSYVLPPDYMTGQHARKAYDLQSDNLYKSDMDWMRGVGWVTSGSVDVEKVKRAGSILSERKYRQPAQQQPFTQVEDTPELVKAKSNQQLCSKLVYKADGEKRLHQYTMDADEPQLLQAKVNSINLSNKCYQFDYEENKATGYDLKADAIPFRAARASSNIVSDRKYKKEYEADKGKHIGARSLQDDPKMVHSMRVAKMQSQREYKKGYEKGKTSYHTPLDMLQVVEAKKAQAMASNVDYKTRLHSYVLPPDYMTGQHARKAYDLQSDSLYKSDLEWIRGCGWIPTESLDVKKVQRAGNILSEKKYRQHPDTVGFTSVTDSPVMQQCKLNADQINDRAYRKAWEDSKTEISMMPDTPQLLQAKANAYNLSDVCYKKGLEEQRALGCDVRADAIPIRAAKACRAIASDVKYKEAFEKAKGHHVGFQSLEDDPKLVHSMRVAKMQSDRAYKKNFEKSKTNYHMPLDMLNLVMAKKCQDMVSDTNYRQRLHDWTCLPDQTSVAHAKMANELQSDTLYKADLDWIRGCGWISVGSLDNVKVQRAGDILSEKKYRQHPDTVGFTSISDSPDMLQAKVNAEQLSDLVYRADGEEAKHSYTLPPDAPQLLQARVNAYNSSDVCYKMAWEKTKDKDFELPLDALSITAAKHSVNIMSDRKYKKEYEADKGKHIGAQSLQDDPKMVHSMRVAKMQSEREYKKGYEKGKTSYHTPLDMLQVVEAKKAQAMASNVDYKTRLHSYVLPPDYMTGQHARKAYDLQSDSLYKSDLEWIRGCGWIPTESLDVKKVQRAGDILSEKKYRQHPDTVGFTSVTDSPVMQQCKLNANQTNDRLYKEAWEQDKVSIHVMPDTPQLLQAKVNTYNLSDIYYKHDLEQMRADGYDLRLDAISIKAAKASRNIASDVKYKEAFEKAKGHHVGFQSLEDDPKLVHSIRVAKMQSDRAYKKDFEKSKTNYHMPLDMLNLVMAKKCQDMVSDTNYRQRLHDWTCLPDQTSVAHAKMANELQSDTLYKSDLDWIRGCGWTPVGSLDNVKVQKAGDILSERKYRQHPDTVGFTSISDSPVMQQYKLNADQINNRLYKEAWEHDKISIHVMPDTPGLLQAKVNSYNLSDVCYKKGLEEQRALGCDVRADAIPIRAAKACRAIASDVKYKEAFEKAKGHHVGFQSLEDDPKLVHSMRVAKMQSDRAYKKDFEKSKTNYHMPLDMLNLVMAKKCQDMVSDTNYRQRLHDWTCLPDQTSVAHAKMANELQSDTLYKADLDWIRGCGWIPVGSLDNVKAQRAGDILSERKYRQHPDTIGFTSITDSPVMQQCKINADQINNRLYKEAWEQDKISIHVMPDTPDMLQAKVNSYNLSDKYYKHSLEQMRSDGYDLRLDAISIKAAKASRSIASDYIYKEAYRKQKGHHVGFRSLEDDPKLVHSIRVAKMQSDREYKKDFEKSKTNYHMPLDMLNLVMAKKCQDMVSDTNYRQRLHDWTCLADQTSVAHAKMANELQSDTLYKADLDWIRGCGWIPVGSLDNVKAQRAGDILSERKYRQHPETVGFTSITNSPFMQQCKLNADQINDRLYKEAWEQDKVSIHVMPDTPQLLQAKVNTYNLSDKYYKQGLEQMKADGYDLRLDAISIKAAKASRNIASDVKYKEAFEKAKGHHVGFQSLEDDPKLVHSMRVAKMQSDRAYKKDFEKSKTNYHMPLDMLNLVMAKKCQDMVSDTNYRQRLHDWTCLPDQTSVTHAKMANELQSDTLYKADLDWIRGCGWIPVGSLDNVKAQRAGDILSERKYRQHPETVGFTSITNSPFMQQCKLNADQINDRLYKEAWEQDKVSIHVMPDTPQLLQARVNTYNLSDKSYKQGLEQMRADGYDLKLDAISIKTAKASRNIASDYIYKEAYRKQKGHHVGFRSLEDDPKLVHSIRVAKMQSDREYKRDFEKSKTNYHMPLDMLNLVMAKKCQDMVSDTNYRQRLHDWTCLADQTSVAHAKMANELQSDTLYKADLDWIRGCGWIPVGSLDNVKAQRAGDILSERKYRQHPETVGFTSITNSPFMQQCKLNADQINDRLYKEAWEHDKVSIHVMPDTPGLLQAKVNSYNLSDKYYKQGLEQMRSDGYDLRLDAISIKAAKASRSIASDYIYKEAYRKQKGHHVGFRSLEDDPKLVHSIRVAKMQSDREYKRDFEKSKTNYHMPLDMLNLVMAKKCQDMVSDTNYRQRLHDWTCLPDQTSVAHAKMANELQSDTLYKADLDWLRGCGWIPVGSLDNVKAQRAGDILSERKYRQHPENVGFTSITNSPFMQQCKLNADQINDRLYKKAWEQDKISIHVMPDTPGLLQAKVNTYNLSDKYYKQGLQQMRADGYDLGLEAISIKAAKASMNIASDVKYKEAFEKAKGHHVGFQSLEDDPKLVHSIRVAKMQSDRAYKKDFEKSKTNYHMPLDMMNLVMAKKCQDMVSDTNYRQRLHDWTCLPDQTSVTHAKMANELQSDTLYKADLDWIRGCGWTPVGSLDNVKAQRAGDILSERKYRQHPETVGFTSITNSPFMQQCKLNADQINDRLYKEAWEQDKVSIHVMPDTPQLLQAKVNTYNLSDKSYKQDLVQMRADGYDLGLEAISVKAAKASRNIASDYLYTEAYRKEKGHHFGFQSLEDDPKLVHSMRVAKMQSDREYKKHFEKSKTNYHMPLDMLNLVMAKKCQDMVSDTNYRQRLHDWTCLPDQTSVAHAKMANELQSDTLYKADLDWLRGCGWIPVGSLDNVKAQRAGDILSERKYRQHPETVGFTSITNSPFMQQCKLNADQINDRLYKKAWEQDKVSIHVMPDTPQLLQAKVNTYNLSDKCYRKGLDKMRADGYDLKSDAISIKAAKASRDIASDYIYKEAYRKDKGHHFGFRSLEDDPKLVHSIRVAKMQSEREYRKDFENIKNSNHIPLDMLNLVMAKKCQDILSDVNYRQRLHDWTCLPDQTSIAHAKMANELQSDALYKADLEWLRGCGWIANESLDMKKSQRAAEILSDKKYRQHPATLSFTSVNDSPFLLQCKLNADQINDRLYRETWEQDKIRIHVMPDTPQMLQAKVNTYNLSDKSYRKGLEQMRADGYDLGSEAISVKAAKASRIIASDYIYKQAYEHDKGQLCGIRSLDDDLRMVNALRVGKLQSDLEYKKDLVESKSNLHIPTDMLNLVVAKKCQDMLSDTTYRQRLHDWTCLPDQTSVAHAKMATELQSDTLYKADLDWIRGCGWISVGSLDNVKAQRAGDILSERKYRQHPETVGFTSITNSPFMQQCKLNADQINDRLYKKAWEQDKISIHVMPDTPQLLQAKVNSYNLSDKSYKQGLEQMRADGYDLGLEAISIKAAKASRNIASDVNYKEAYEKEKGHYIGFQYLDDDIKMLHSTRVGKLLSNLEYKKDFDESKGKFHIPTDMMNVVMAKKCQDILSDVNYRQKLHDWTCLPDQTSIAHAKMANELQSDALYKADLEWLRGCGWIANGSLDMKKAQRAAEILSDKKYRQHPATLSFTSVNDSPFLLQCKLNADQINDRLYKEAWEQDKVSIHVMPDTPQLLQAKVNTYNLSDKSYRKDWEESRALGHDVRFDAIPIRSAMASRDICSDYKYKENYEKEKGQHLGIASLKDDLRMVNAFRAGKLQSDLEYKKNFDDNKSKFHIPTDMMNVVMAKKCQDILSDVNYRQRLHDWTCLPDQTSVAHAKMANELQSDALYKADLEWLRGCGWIANDSVDLKKAQRAAEILSERKYRQHPCSVGFTSVTNSPGLLQAKISAALMNNRLYTEQWNKDKGVIHLMPDAPLFILAKNNSYNINQRNYTRQWEEMKREGNHMKPDAIPVQAAKAAHLLISGIKYKEAYEKEKGQHLGIASLKDDLRMVNAFRAGKLQSELEYKKDFDDNKSKFHIPMDMMNVVMAKKCQDILSDVNYRQRLHDWTCLPDQTSIAHAKMANELQSDALYKADLEWLRGCGWIANDSLEVKKAQRAGEILSDKKYRQPPATIRFTSVTDAPFMLQCKVNADQINSRLYRKLWDADKTQIHVMPDTPELLQAKVNTVNLSDKHYRGAWRESRAQGYDMRIDAMPLQLARKSHDIISDYKYKESHEKGKGQLIGFRRLQDDPRLVHSARTAIMLNARLYRQKFEDNKTKCVTPADALSVLQAKKCQHQLSDIPYRTYLRHWTCLPHQGPLLHAKHAQDLLSDNLYKEDLLWMRGLGCSVWDTPENLRAKEAYNHRSDIKYQAEAKVGQLKFTVVTDTPGYLTALTSAQQLSDIKYKAQYKAARGVYTPVLDSVDNLRVANAQKLFSNNLYKEAWQRVKAKGFSLPVDTVHLQNARHQQSLYSPRKYRAEYEQMKAHFTQPKLLKEDPRALHALHAGNILSNLLYTAAYNKAKGALHLAPDMMEVVVAKRAQDLASGQGYRSLRRSWICLPDMQQLEHARHAQELYSDVAYKDDLKWSRGIGCFVWDTPSILQAKQSRDQCSDVRYRAQAEAARSAFTPVLDTPGYLQAQTVRGYSDNKYKRHYLSEVRGRPVQGAKRLDIAHAVATARLRNDRWYQQGLKLLPTSYHLPVDTIALATAKAAHGLTSNMLYRDNYEKGKAAGYRLPHDAVGFRTALHVGLLQNQRLYRVAYENGKANIHLGKDLPEITHVRAVQKAISRLDYRAAYELTRGRPMTLAWTPELLHCRLVGEQLSDVKYKEDLHCMQGTGCYLFNSPAFTLAREAKRYGSAYTKGAKVLLGNPKVVLDTPEYLRLQQNKEHTSDLVYRATGNVLKSRYTPVLDTPVLLRAKYAQELQSQSLYTDDAKRNVLHSYKMHADTPALLHAKAASQLINGRRYRAEYEQLKQKFVSRLDSPAILTAKRAHHLASDLRYKEAFEKDKGRYNMREDACELRHHRLVTDRISDVKYKENYVQGGGVWSHLPFLPELIHHKDVTEAISDVRYKEDVGYLRGIGCNMWGNPDMVMAKRNQQLYSAAVYHKDWDLNRGKFSFTADTPVLQTAKMAAVLISQLKYKAKYEKMKSKFTPVLEEPRNLHAKAMQVQQSPWMYKKDFEKMKTKFTLLVDMPSIKQAKAAAKLISDIVYKEKHNKTKHIGFTPLQDSPFLRHVKKADAHTSYWKYRDEYDRKKDTYTLPPDAVPLCTAKQAYAISLDRPYRAQYEKTKARWVEVPDRPDMVSAMRATVQLSDAEYRQDREMLKGCKFSVTNDKLMVLAKQGQDLASGIKYHEQFQQMKDKFTPVADSPVLNNVKNASNLASEVKYKEAGKKVLPKPAFSKIPQTPQTALVKKLSKLQSGKCYRQKHDQERGKSDYASMEHPPDVQHAMDVNKKQSSVAYKKAARASLNYTQVADRPDILKAQQAAKLISNIEYRAKAKEEAAGLITGMATRPDIDHATGVSHLVSQVEYTKQKPRGHGAASYDTPLMRQLKKASNLISHTKYKEKFDKEVKGKKPHFKADESTTYKANKQATALASEVKYKEDLKKMHTPGVGLASSLLMQHITSTSKLSSENVYKKEFEKSRGKYLHVVDGPQQVHHREVTDMQSESKYKQDYEKSKGKPMLDFETPTFITARESQLMQREKVYRRDFEEGMKGRNLNVLETTPAYLCVKHASSILSEREYKKDLERVIKGKGMTVQDMNTPDLQRAKNATSILSQTKYKEMAGKELGVYISVVDSPDIVHARHVKDITSSIKYKADAVRERGHFVSVLDTPQFNTVKENQKNFSEIQYRDPMASGTCATDTPELRHAKQAQHIISTVKYKDYPGKATPVPFTPEVERVRRNQEHVSDVKYREQLGRGTAMMLTPEMERVRRNQANVSDVRYKEQLGRGTAVMFTPEMERVRRSQANVSDIKYKEQLGRGTAVMFTPEMERVRTNQVNVSDVKYKEAMRRCMAISLTPEMERLHHNRANVSVVQYKERLGKYTPVNIPSDLERLRETERHMNAAHYKDLGRWDQQGRSMCLLDTPEMRRVRQNQRDISMVKYHADFERSKARGFTPVTDDPITERVRKNTQDVSDITYKGITRRVVEMESTSAEQGGTTDLRVWRTNPGSIFDYDPAEDNIQSRSLRVVSVQAKRCGREYPRSLSALSTSTGDEKSEMSGPTRTASFCSNTYSSQPAVQFQVSQQVQTGHSEGTQDQSGHAVGSRVQTGYSVGTQGQSSHSVGSRVQTHYSVGTQGQSGHSAGTKAQTGYSAGSQGQSGYSAGTRMQTSDIVGRQGQREQPVGTKMQTGYSVGAQDQSSRSAGARVQTDYSVGSQGQSGHSAGNRMQTSYIVGNQGQSEQMVGTKMQSSYSLGTQDQSSHSVGTRVQTGYSVGTQDQSDHSLGTRIQSGYSVGSQGQSGHTVGTHGQSSHSVGTRVQTHYSVGPQAHSGYSTDFRGQTGHPVGNQGQGGHSVGTRMQTHYTVGTKVHTGQSVGGYLMGSQMRSSSSMQTAFLASAGVNVSASHRQLLSPVSSHLSSTSRIYRAVYEYTAADRDEVSFQDGDVIVNTQQIDEGWMYGTVQRTGISGMLPANYVQAL